MGSKLLNETCPSQKYKWLFLLIFIVANTTKRDTPHSLWKTLWEIMIPLEFSTIDGHLCSAKLARCVQYKIAASGIRGWTEKSDPGEAPSRRPTHQIFDVTNPKKVGGSTMGPGTPKHASVKE